MSINIVTIYTLRSESIYFNGNLCKKCLDAHICLPDLEANTDIYVAGGAKGREIRMQARQNYFLLSCF